MLDREESRVKLNLGKQGWEEDFKNFISHDLIL